MNQGDRNYDLRQYRQMLQVIQNYKEVMQNNNLQDLGQLISELDALRASLIARSESFGKQFDPAWATLEEVYAVLLDRDETHLDEIGQKLVSEAMGHIESLIRSEISTA